MSGAFDVGNLTITYNRLWIIVFALLVFAALILILKRTPFGLQMRAVTQNRAMASAMGIRTPWIDALTFGLGSGIAGIAGVALSQIDNVSPNLGQGYIIDSFMVVVFGGVGNLWGTLVGALTLGIANKFLEPFAGAVLGKIAILVFIILFIQKRPRGLFALAAGRCEGPHPPRCAWSPFRCGRDRFSHCDRKVMGGVPRRDRFPLPVHLRSGGMILRAANRETALSAGHRLPLWPSICPANRSLEIRERGKQRGRRDVPLSSLLPTPLQIEQTPPPQGGEGGFRQSLATCPPPFGGVISTSSAFSPTRWCGDHHPRR